MKHLDWIKDISIFKDVQERIESDCQSLIDAYFHKDDDYAIEKFLKTYTEGFRYLEKLLLMQRKVAPKNVFDEPKFDIAEFQKKREEVRKVMLNEAKRQYRHAIIFMSSLKSHSPELVEERKNFALLESAIEKILELETARKVFNEYHKSREQS